MLGKGDHWNKIDETMVPGDSPVTDSAYWKVAGMLIALVLLEGDSTCPVSPAIIYALLSNVRERQDQCALMNLSLRFISRLQISDSKAQILLPWMIIPPGTDWTTLPDNHQLQIQGLLAGLGLEVSGKHLSFCVDGDSNSSAPNGIDDEREGRPRSVDCSHFLLCIVWDSQPFLHSTIPGVVDWFPNVPQGGGWSLVPSRFCYS